MIPLKGSFSVFAQNPRQPETGPGGTDYAHRTVRWYDHGARADGYWLFAPADPVPAIAPVVVLMHGYGAYNPMIYGKWIKHLVGKGNTVIYPRYQRNLILPRPNAFPANAATAIRHALQVLQREVGYSRPLTTERLSYIGHSYGGVISSHLGVHWQQYHLPPPDAMLLVEPGSGPFSGARLTDYGGFPDDLRLLVVVGEDDIVVGAEFGALVYNTARQVHRRNFLLQRRDLSGTRSIGATHTEPYCPDLDFDTGVRNFTALRALSAGRTNEVDYAYWRLADALLDDTRYGRNGHIAFGNTPQQCFMGYHDDGRPIRPMEAWMPPSEIRLLSRQQSRQRTS